MSSNREGTSGTGPPWQIRSLWIGGPPETTTTYPRNMIWKML